MYAPSDIRYI